MSGHDAETHADGPFAATARSEGGEPGHELDILTEKPELLEVVDAEPVDEKPAGVGASGGIVPGAPFTDGYTSDGTPTLAYVRQRIAASLAEKEVFDQSAPAISEEARQEELRQAAAAKLKSLRESLGQESVSEKD